jgi:hypothetical protein
MTPPKRSRKFDQKGPTSIGDAFKDWSRENFKRVLVSPKLVLNGVAKDEHLRRFVDLPKLFDLLKNGRLVFPKLGQLLETDPFECFARQNFNQLSRPEIEEKANQLKRFAPASTEGFKYPPGTTNIWARLGQGRPLFDSQIKAMTLEELKHAAWYLERERLKNELVCSCWYKGSVESDAMWKIYASQMGVAITTSAARMESAIKLIAPRIFEHRTDLKLAAIHYEDTDQCGNREPWLIKRKAFDHEKEVRLYCDVPFDFGLRFEVQVDVSKFIEEIVITPFAQQWEFGGIKAAIEALLKAIGASQVVVRQSKHMRAPEVGWPPEIQARNELIKKLMERES